MSFSLLKILIIFPFIFLDLNKLLSSKFISLFLYVSINFSSIIAFSSSFNSPKIKLKNPINFMILLARYPFSFFSKLSFLISNIFIYVSEFGPSFNNVPSKEAHNPVYSLSGSIIY